MFIEINLRAKVGDVTQKWEFLFNSDKLTLIVLNLHNCSLLMELNNHTLFEFENQEDTQNVYEAFKCALTGIKNKELREDLGYVRPVPRPFMDDTTLIPSAYEGDELK